MAAMYLINEHGQKPEDIALADAAGGFSLSYGSLAEAVRDESARLAATGGRLGFCFCRNDPATVIAYLAAVDAEIALVLLDAGMKEAPRRRLIDRYEPDFMVAPPELELAAEYRRLPGLQGRLDLWARDPNELQSPHPDLALLLPTSGSTGSPKLVRLSRANLEANAASINQVLPIDSSERAITSLPLFYSYGLSVLNSHLLAGARVVMTSEAVVQRAFWQAFRDHECTSFAGVPYTYHMLRRMRFEGMKLPSLRYMTQAGGGLERDLVLWAHATLRKWGASFFVMYGQTEATARMSCLPEHELPARAGSVGLAIPGGELLVRDPDGMAVDHGVSGEVVYRGPNVMMGYATCREDLLRADDLGGELATGDHGHLDDQGMLFVTGRNRRFAKVMGLRINLAEVEAALAGTTPVAAVAADERVVVFLEGVRSEDLDEHRRTLLDELSLDPQAVELRAAEALPLAANLKVDYQELARWI